jgi:hypothetical protein
VDGLLNQNFLIPFWMEKDDRGNENGNGKGNVNIDSNIVKIIHCLRRYICHKTSSDYFIPKGNRKMKVIL